MREDFANSTVTAEDLVQVLMTLTRPIRRRVATHRRHSSMLILLGDKIIWWATERTWGTFSYSN
jgi:hypothetical protein